ncbi:Yop proteins translocation protein L [Pseudobythopirellula maris]|uniref:Flagellar assembly protein FliH n=1 Tax=Pseudobythopirellula maris TaxID=2527991 RepID=A0A5C5ZI90_9BACT|nr:FliH/SctL family protein [Pseudobythopirellula maris]TWT86521.1 Yop proteins translocation protein L [Pseudobythopirellula maris]
MATIIKRDSVHEQSTGETVRPVAYDLRSVERYGEEYVESIRREAARIVQQANSEAGAIRTKAEKEGREAAKAALSKMLDDKLASQMLTLKPALEQAVEELTRARGEWLTRWEGEAIELAIKIAERLVRRELGKRPEITVGWVREALELASGSSSVTVRLNPEDHEHLRDEVENVARSISTVAPAELVADPAITPGGCRVDTRHGSIDAQLESQLARLLEEMT